MTTTRDTKRQAIRTKYLGPTNTRSSQVKATAYGGSKTIAYDTGLGISENHIAACDALVAKMGWGGTWVGGGDPSGHGLVFVDIS